jgi:hypothetical protein
VADGSLSFLGVIFNDRNLIGRVRITSGNDWTPADLLAQLTTASAPRD